ncbi:hypothetical protein [Montanilutibacter psychrotolerans]|uniref:XRE family transcriptional regulator n=1 Tax=Montanilutibacter psychrotolerans TaxID=1327343 RepID=A0A3M8SVQ9_9GAMM|nr:hypothetical protein [Lysobacter psychrotolerans]RNF85379.1 hypothetical protein EER27_06350 [Lysobacter psychrotolerans]
MPVSEFPAVLSQHMRRIRASAAGVASEIGMSREAINNWRNGDSLPSRKHRDKVLACATYLRLTEAETNRLLASAGFEPEFPVELASAPGPGPGPVPPAVLQVFERLQQLRPYPILMLLSQAHWGQPPEREAMLAHARHHYGADAVLHMQPPFCPGADSAVYFAALATQCGFDGVDSDHAFEARLARRLRDGGQLFCLVSRFEQGDPAQRDVLAGILRSLSEMHSGRLHLLICGGAALADLKYQGGDLSLLNIATAETWPELTATDLQAMARARWGERPVDAARVLRLSGGHPLLADAALTMLADHGMLDDEALTDALAGHPPLWQGFLPLLTDPASRATILPWLRQSRLGPARPYLFDPLLRALYWANLVTPRREDDGTWLQWRCEAIRRAGLMIAEQTGPTSA